MRRLAQKPTRNSGMISRINHIQMSKCDREATLLYMEQAESFAEAICRAESALRFLAREIGHGCRILAHRAKMAFGKPVHH
ncbi:MAG: hypothetical protein ACK4N4_03745 [Burkholderiales bacterium]